MCPWVLLNSYLCILISFPCVLSSDLSSTLSGGEGRTRKRREDGGIEWSEMMAASENWKMLPSEDMYGLFKLQT